MDRGAIYQVCLGFWPLAYYRRRSTGRIVERRSTVRRCVLARSIDHDGVFLEALRSREYVDLLHAVRAECREPRLPGWLTRLWLPYRSDALAEDDVAFDMG